MIATWGYAILMSPEWGPGCHRRDDMVVCMRRVDTAELIRVLKYLALRIMAVLVGRAK